LKHIIAFLTHIIAQKGVLERFLGRNSPSFVYNFSGQVYESILVSGEDMLQQEQERIFSLSSMNWRFYESELAKICSF